MTYYFSNDRTLMARLNDFTKLTSHKRMPLFLVQILRINIYTDILRRLFFLALWH